MTTLSRIINRKVILFIVSIMSSILGTSTWDYDNPDFWGLLTLPANEINYCSITSEYSTKQSPININTYTLSTCSSNLPLTWYLNDDIDEFEVENTGHNIKFIPFIGLNVDKYRFGIILNNFISSENQHQAYCLHSFHIHWGQNDVTGSEHTINNHAAVLELHFVHYACDYDDITAALSADPIDTNALAVVAVLYEIGAENPFIKQVTEALLIGLPIQQAHGQIQITGVSMEQLVPNIDKNSKFYHYKGSLTTPPCTPVVLWHVLEDKMALSRYQLYQLRTKVFSLNSPNGYRLSAPNYRPVQFNSNPVSSCPS
eukprot:25871_1